MNSEKQIRSLASFSDFHLGLRNGSREFRGVEAQALEFIDFLEKEYDQILVLGDIYGALENRGRIDEIRKRYPALSERIEALPQKIWGNHDFKVRKSYWHHPWQASFLATFDDRKFFAIHGYQFDRYNRNPEQGLGAFLSQSHSFLENRIRKNFDKIRRKYHLPKQVKSSLQLIQILNFERNIKKFTEHFGLDVILTGHMHNATVRRFPNGQLYINNGSCVKEYLYSHILPFDQVYEIRRWNPLTAQSEVIRQVEETRYSPWIGRLMENWLKNRRELQ